MRGSGLEEILKSSFGVPKLLSGKKFPQNVRALCIVTEEILRPVLDDQGLHTTSDLLKYLDLKSQQSSTTKLWVDCLIKPVLIMMKFVRAERERDWPLHLCAVEDMLPYIFAYLFSFILFFLSIFLFFLIQPYLLRILQTHGANYLPKSFEASNTRQ